MSKSSFWRAAVVATILAMTSGCGTGANFSGHHTWLFGTPVTPYPIPYGGVASNVKLAIDRPEMTAFAAFDLCLCLVSDTLTLPWVVYYDIKEVAERISPPEPTPLQPPDPNGPAPLPAMPKVM